MRILGKFNQEINSKGSLNKTKKKKSNAYTYLSSNCFFKH